MRLLSAAIFAVVAIFACSSVHAIDIVTSFTSSLGGWTGDNIDHRDANGNPGGWARFTDNPSVPNSFIVAPPIYHGSWLSYKDVGALSYDHKILSVGGTYTVAPYRVNIFGPSGEATWLFEPTTVPTPGVWRRVVAPIKQSEWIVVGNWDQILSDVTRLEIQIEIVSGNGALSDIEGIDNVKLYTLPPPSADFDDDNDVDGADFLIWQQNYGTGTQLHQGDTNDTGSVDGVDLSIWETQYGNPPPLVSSIVTLPEPSVGAMLLAMALLGCLRR